MYSAAFGSMFDGSMCGAGSNVFAVWLFALSRCDKDGDIELCPKSVSLLIGCSEEDVVGALKFLTAPDKDSRSGDAGGRRLIKTGHFMHRIVNHGHYLKIASYEKKKEADRERMARRRAEEAVKQTTVANRSEESQGVAHGPGPGPGPGDNEKTTSSSSSRGDDSAFLNEVLEFWEDNELRPAIVAVSDQRRSSILARRKQHGRDLVMRMLDKRAKSEFLCYTYGDGRGAPVDWCFGPKNFVKICDGNFDATDGGEDYHQQALKRAEREERERAELQP